MKKLFSVLLFIAISNCLFSQVYYSFISYTPTYETEIQNLQTVIFINEDKNSIIFHNATYDGEIINLKIDSIFSKNWKFEFYPTKTYICTDLDEWRVKVYVLDLIKFKNTIKLIYKWDDISIEEYSYMVKE